MADGGDVGPKAGQPSMAATDKEAEAVAAAIGLIPEYDKPAGFTEAYEVHPLSHSVSGGTGPETDNEDGPLDSRALKSPILHNDASSTISSDSSDSLTDDDDETARFEGTRR